MFLSIYEIPHKRKYARWAWGLPGFSWRRSTMSRPWWTGCFVQKIFKRLTFRFFARLLLKLGVFFVIVYTCFTITVGVFPGTSDDSISDLKRMEKDLPKEANIDHKGEQRVAEGILGELHIIAGVFNLLQVRHYKEVDKPARLSFSCSLDLLLIYTYTGLQLPSLISIKQI